MNHPASALLIIDMQYDFAVPGGACEVPGAHATIPGIRKILTRYRELTWPVFHIVREYRSDGSDVEISRQKQFTATPMVVPGTQGARIAPGLEPLESEYRIIKQRFSAFMFTELDLLLRRKNIDTVIVTGTQLPFCLRTTLFDGLSLGYRMILITDGASSKTPEIHQANIRDVRDVGIECLTITEYLQRISFAD